VAAGGGFSWLTTGDITNQPGPAKQASWTLTGVPRFPTATSPSGTTQGTVIPGRILPHRAQITLTYYCYMWNNFPAPVAEAGVIQQDQMGPSHTHQAVDSVLAGLVGVGVAVGANELNRNMRRRVHDEG
jgi:hypothetical protein